jgi:ankyrin repeat protein
MCIRCTVDLTPGRLPACRSIRKTEIGEKMKKLVTFSMAAAICLTIAGCARQRERSVQTDALFRAVIDGNTEMVRSLLSAPGADVNARNDRGSTPLLEAARYGHNDIARTLIAAGANVNAKDNDGKTALMLAVQGNHEEVVRVLKQAGETQ